MWLHGAVPGAIAILCSTPGRVHRKDNSQRGSPERCILSVRWQGASWDLRARLELQLRPLADLRVELAPLIRELCLHVGRGGVVANVESERWVSLAELTFEVSIALGLHG